MKMMRLAFSALMIANYLSAAVIPADLSTVGTNGLGETVYRYTYNLEGFSLQLNQELDIRFDAAIFKELLNGVAPAGFDLLLFQPGSPSGAPGDYSLLALIDNPPMAGIFSVDFILFGGSPPAAQQYFVNQYDDSGNFLNTVSSGQTAVPEPGTLWLVSGLIGAGLMRVVSRVRR